MSDLQIGSIRVRAEGLTPAEGQQLGERIVTLLAERLAGAAVAGRDLGYLQARVSAHGGETVEQLATRVVSAIIERM